VRCTRIGVTINNSLALVSHLSLSYQSQGHFNLSHNLKFYCIQNKVLLLFLIMTWLNTSYFWIMALDLKCLNSILLIFITYKLGIVKARLFLLQSKSHLDDLHGAFRDQGPLCPFNSFLFGGSQTITFVQWFILSQYGHCLFNSFWVSCNDFPPPKKKQLYKLSLISYHHNTGVPLHCQVEHHVR
jgi:hypothetical protein